MVTQTGLQPVTWVLNTTQTPMSDNRRMSAGAFIVPRSCSYGKLDECLSLICWLFSLEMGKLCYFHFLNLLYLFKVFMCTIQKYIYIYICVQEIMTVTGGKVSVWFFSFQCNSDKVPTRPRRGCFDPKRLAGAGWEPG